MSQNLKRPADNTYSRYKPPPKRQTTENIQHDPRFSKLLSAVFNQGRLGQLVVIEHENETPYVTLQNALCYANIALNVLKESPETSDFVLKIGEETFARGAFSSVQLARAALAQEALTKLKNQCFFIKKKKNYVDITNQDLAAVSSSSTPKFEEAVPALDEFSVAHRMMQKMGWSAGKGLGSQEQGNVDTVVVYENISRRGFGNKNIMKEITKVLDNFAKSTKFLTTLAFDADFTKDERNLIHKVARQFNLKSKSEGKEPNRRITVARKLTRVDIVKELLNIGGENDSYKLEIPSNFAHLL